jgi:hypothetical protein
MPSTATSALLLFLILAAIGLVAFLFAWSVGRLGRLRRAQDPASARSGRSWGGRDYQRMRSKYFDKERKVRAARERTRGTASPPPRAHDDDYPASPATDVERTHRETLGLTGVEITLRTLREAYRQRIREYHPDRVAALGAKLRSLAEEETKRINDAYRYLRQRVRD